MGGTTTASRYDAGKNFLFITFQIQGQMMILADCEVCGVESVGGGHEIMRYGIMSKWWPNSKWPTLY